MENAGGLVLAFPIFFPSILFNQPRWLDSLSKSLDHHVVIIDAGSSGSRVLSYKFQVRRTMLRPPTLDLVQEYFAETWPGLASYANDPEKGAQTIVDLIKKADFMVPESRRNETPILVRATAGLRLLPQDKAQQLIEHVSKAISDLDYGTGPEGQEAVAVMSGTEEGINGWYTMNLLNNLLDKKRKMVALDLGGGSTQITYEIANNDNSVPEEDRHVVPVGKNITLYSHSYLRLGLKANRYGVLRTESGHDRSQLSSVCVHPVVQRKSWTYDNNQYNVSGVQRPKSMKKSEVFLKCHNLVKKYVKKTLDWEPLHPPRGRVGGISSFYSVTVDAGVPEVEPAKEKAYNKGMGDVAGKKTTKDKKGLTLSVGSFRRKALQACSKGNVEKPWTCIDLVYIYTLLHDAYKLDEEKEISVYKKIDGHVVSWALGLAYTTVTKQIIADVLADLQNGDS